MAIFYYIDNTYMFKISKQCKEIKQTNQNFVNYGVDVSESE